MKKRRPGLVMVSDTLCPALHILGTLGRVSKGLGPGRGVAVWGDGTDVCLDGRKYELSDVRMFGCSDGRTEIPPSVQ